MSHYRALRDMYLAAKCNQHFEQLDLNISENRSALTCFLGPDQHHAAGAVHGSFLFKLLDDAAFFAAQSVQEDHFVLTQSYHLHFMRPFVDGLVEARGEVIKNGKGLMFARSTLTDQQGKELASGSGTFAVSRIPLSNINFYSE